MHLELIDFFDQQANAKKREQPEDRACVRQVAAALSVLLCAGSAAVSSGAVFRTRRAGDGRLSISALTRRARCHRARSLRRSSASYVCSLGRRRHARDPSSCYSRSPVPLMPCRFLRLGLALLPALCKSRCRLSFQSASADTAASSTVTRPRGCYRKQSSHIA